MRIVMKLFILFLLLFRVIPTYATSTMHLNVYATPNSPRINDLSCDVTIGKSTYKVKIPSSLEISPKKDDLFKIYCEHNDYVMIEQYYYSQSPYNEYEHAKHLSACNSMNIATLGTAFVGIPLALLLQNPLFLLAPPLFAGGIYVYDVATKIKTSNNFIYPYMTVDVALKHKTILTSEDKAMKAGRHLEPYAIASGNNKSCPH